MVTATQPKFFMTGPSYAPQTVLRSADWRAAPAPPPGPPPASVPPLLGASRTIAPAAAAALRANPAFFANPYFWGLLGGAALVAGGIYLMTKENPGVIPFDGYNHQGSTPFGGAGILFYRTTTTDKDFFTGAPTGPFRDPSPSGWRAYGPVPNGWTIQTTVTPVGSGRSRFSYSVQFPGAPPHDPNSGVESVSSIISTYVQAPGQAPPSSDPNTIPSAPPPAFSPERPPYVPPSVPPGPIVYVPGRDGGVIPVPVIWHPFDYDPQSPGQRTPTIPRSPVISGRAGPWNFTHNPATDDWVWSPNPELDPGVYYPPADEPEPRRSPTPIFLPDRSGELNPPTQTSSPPITPLTLRIRTANDCCPNPFGQPQESDCATAEDVLGIVQRKKIVLEKRPLEALTSSNAEAESGQIIVPYGDERFVDVVLTVMPSNLRMQSGGLSAPNVFFCGWITGVSDGERVPVSHSSQRFRLPPLLSGESVVTYTFTNGVKGVVSSLVQRYELKEFGDPILNPPE